MSNTNIKVGLFIFILSHLLFMTVGQRGNVPTLAQYYLELASYQNYESPHYQRRPYKSGWIFVLPEDTDIDQDGKLSDAEVEQKAESYLGELFKMMDQNKDNILEKNEVVDLKLEIPRLNGIIDIAMEHYPIKSVLLAADGNGDGFYDETDFNKAGDVCHKENGFCVLPNGNDQNSGVMKLDDVDGNSDEQQASCLSRCLAYPGATGCEIIWIHFNHGCYVHTQDVSRGNEVDNHACWIFSKCTGNSTGEIDSDLATLVNWRWNYKMWEEYGRFLFLADTNQDEKITLEEIASKAKAYLGGILGFLDQNDDGHLSVEDFTSLNIKKEKINEIFDLLFNDIADRNTEAIDLFNLKIAGLNMTRYFRQQYWDNNDDQKLNSVDFYWRLSRYTEKVEFLIPMLIQKLDKDQDGKIKRQELRLFTEDIFKEITRNDAITLQDIYRIMRTNDFDCFQVGALRTYINMITNLVDIQFVKLMTYIFNQIDLDGNGHIGITEFQKMQFPCVTCHFMPCSIELALANEKYNHIDRKTCDDLAEEIIFGPFEVVRWFPDLEMRPRRRDGVMSIADKLANAACEILA